ncbi:MAG: hypothetical protein RCG15_03600 [Candidatus Rickettsia vulgarisii]
MKEYAPHIPKKSNSSKDLGKKSFAEEVLRSRGKSMEQKTI